MKLVIVPDVTDWSRVKVPEANGVEPLKVRSAWPVPGVLSAINVPPYSNGSSNRTTNPANERPNAGHNEIPNPSSTVR
jgi:hypothetical protein